MELELNEIQYTSDMSPEQMEEYWNEQTEQYTDKDSDPEQRSGTESETTQESNITISDLQDILRIVVNGDSENEVNEGENIETDIPSDTVPVTPEETEDTEIQTYDYTQLLQDIKNQIISDNNLARQQQATLIEYTENNQSNTSIDSISINTLLLILIFSSLLVNILINIIKGVF